jgi:ferredoxin-NADP reductase
MEEIVSTLNTEYITHDVRRFQVEKPAGYIFIPGQATEVSVNTPQFKDEKRPFTFTGLNNEPFLEFTIKIYTGHNGVTKELGALKTGDELIIRDVWGAISYKGPGIFIAGGAGITPFISIFRDLGTKNEVAGNKLIFGNKTKADIILESEFRKLLGSSFINILSEEITPEYSYGFIDEEFLRANISGSDQNFYLCGPPPMVDSVTKYLKDIGIEEKSITLEL